MFPSHDQGGRDSAQLSKDLQLDPIIQYLPEKAELKKEKITLAGKERTIYRPKPGNTIGFQDNYAYFNPRLKRFLVYQAEEDYFVPYGGYKP